MITYRRSHLIDICNHNSDGFYEFMQLIIKEINGYKVLLHLM
jgi:hypothetical protein